MPLVRRSSWISCVLASVVLASCARRGDAIETFPVGEPVGERVHTVITSAGGTLVLADGSITVFVPEGAVEAPFELSVQEITRTAPHGDARAFRLGAEGQTFAIPVTIRFALTEAELARRSVESLLPVYQDETGGWYFASDSELDVEAGTLTVRTTHFSDWTYVESFELDPPSETVMTGDSLDLVVRFCGYEEYPDESDPDLVLVALTRTCHALAMSPLAHQASVNGVLGGNAEIGTVEKNGSTLTYTAPTAVPSSGPVAVSSAIRIFGRRTQVLVVSEITVVGGDQYHGTAWFDAGDGMTSQAEITWTMTERDGHTVYYAPSGTLSVTYGECSISPAIGSIAPNEGWLQVDWSTSPPRYYGGGTTTWDATYVCDGATYSMPAGAQWLNAGDGIANEDGTVLEGTNGFWRWSFTR